MVATLRGVTGAAAGHAAVDVIHHETGFLSPLIRNKLFARRAECTVTVTLAASAPRESALRVSVPPAAGSAGPAQRQRFPSNANNPNPAPMRAAGHPYNKNQISSLGLDVIRTATFAAIFESRNN